MPSEQTVLGGGDGAGLPYKKDVAACRAVSLRGETVSSHAHNWILVLLRKSFYLRVPPGPRQTVRQLNITLDLRYLPQTERVQHL